MYRIRDLREDRDLSQADIAKVIQTTQQQYSKIETGKASNEALFPFPMEHWCQLGFVKKGDKPLAFD